MKAWLRVFRRTAVFAACAGVVTGLWIAYQEISANRYFAQGLWRTALWLASHGAMVGAMASVGVGAFLAIWIIVRRPSAGEEAAEVVERRLALAVILTAALALGIVLLPAEAPEILERPARAVFGAGLFVFWAMTTAFLLSRTSEESPPAGSVEGVWTILVWLGYIVALAHLWARVAPGLLMAYLACGGLLGAIAVYSVFGRPVQSLARVVGGRVRRPVALRRLHLLSVTVLVLGVVLWVGGEAEARRARGSPGPSRPNLLIIAVDTLRADRVSLVSKPTSGWDTTPNLRERLAPHGTYFTRAHSQAPWTMPSFASILTGLYPEEHGAQVGEGRLLPHQLTLAEILRDCGYRTMAVVSGNFVSSEVGMLQGFDLTDESQVAGRDAVTSTQVTDRALGLLAARRDAPFFMFVHYFDPHWTYQMHEGFHFADRGLKLHLPEKLKVLMDPETFFTPRQLNQIKALYAEEIAFTDSNLARLLAYLEEHRLWDSTCVVFVGDHGDEFVEHGGFEHGETVFEEMVHVPLFVAGPSRRAPAVVDDVVETRWLFGTILEMLGIRRPASHATTHNLFSPPQDGEYYARSSLYGQQSCLTGKQYKLVEDPNLRRPILPTAPSDREAGRGQMRRIGPGHKRTTMLFDLLRDPGETKDLSKELPEITRRLRSTLETINGELARREEHAPMPRLSEDQKRKLRALGYL